VWFEVDVARSGVYDVQLQYACPKRDAGSTIRVWAGDAELIGGVAAAEAPAAPLPHRDNRSHERYVNRRWGALLLGRLKLPAGRQRLTVEVVSLPGDQALELKGVTLKYLDD
jgi:hypothetical protein